MIYSSKNSNPSHFVIDIVENDLLK